MNQKNHVAREEASDQPVYSSLPAGKYEFKDNGIYIGEWLNEKAVGIGLLTKDKSQGEYTGLWNNGSEKCGVFLWPSAPGAMYEGDWAASKRNGYGVFVKEDWVIKGKFHEGFMTSGVRFKEQSIGKFEGEFKDGCPGFGMETYADGGTYCGDLQTGLRHGYGVRASSAYGDVFPNLLEEIQKKPRSGLINGNGTANMSPLLPLKLPNQFKGGFVLSSRKSDLLMKKLKHISQCKKHRKKGMKRSHSLTSVFSAIKKKEFYNTAHHYQLNGAVDYSVKSVPDVGISIGAAGNSSPKSMHSSLTFQTVASLTANNRTNSDTIGANVTEIYSGQWVQDQRHGYGVCQRSDGVVYEGGWNKNQRHGFGFTRFGDGTFEEGEYCDGQLISLWTRRNIILFLYSLRLTLKIQKSVKLARDAARQAQQKEAECRKKLIEIREAAKKADESAALAREYSLETRMLVKLMCPDYEQPGIKCLKDIVRMMRVTKKFEPAFETMLEAALDIVEGRGIPEMLINPESLIEGHDKTNFEMTDDTGKKLTSRHGSFRRSKNIQSQSETIVEETIESKKVGSNLESSAGPNSALNQRQAGRLDRRIDKTNTLNKPHQQSTIQQQQTNHQQQPNHQQPNHQQPNHQQPNHQQPNHQQPNHQQPNHQQPNHQQHQQTLNKINTRIVVEDTSNDKSKNANKRNSTQLNLSGRNSLLSPKTLTSLSNSLNANANELSMDTNETMNEDEEDGEQYIIPNNIMATSSIPQEPLQNILTPNAMQDHFHHYQDRIVSNLTPKIPNAASTTSLFQIHNKPNSPRRYTNPDIMSQPPVRPKPVAEAFCQLEEEEEEDEEYSVSNVLYVIQNGVRKKVSQVEQNVEDNITGSRVTLNPPQDTLTPLAMHFRFQSQVNLRKDLKEGSLPDVSETRRRLGMTRDEATRLGDECREAQALDVAKQQQGVFVIRLQLFKDWVYANLLTVSIVIGNLFIFYIFLLISNGSKIS